MELRNIPESEKKPQQPLLPSSLLLLLLFFNFTRTSPEELRLQSNKSSKSFVFGENPNSPFNSRIWEKLNYSASSPPPPHFFLLLLFFNLTRAWPELLQSNKSPNLLFGEELPKVGWRAHSKSVFFSSLFSLFCCQSSTWYQSLVATFHLHGDGVLGAWIFHFLNPFLYDLGPHISSLTSQHPSHHHHPLICFLENLWWKLMMQIFVYQKIGLPKIQSRCCYDYILISNTHNCYSRADEVPGEWVIPSY